MMSTFFQNIFKMQLLGGRRNSRRRTGFDKVLSFLQSVPELSIFAKAIELSDLADDLEDEGPFTVFAPINSAFDRIGRDRALANIDRKVEF